MEDTAISDCNFDNDSPLYVGQGPMVAELDDDDVRSSTAVDGHSELGQDGEQEVSCPNTNLVSSEKQSGDHPSVDPHQNMESCQALKNDSPDTGNTDSFDWTRDSGCTKVDEYCDDDDDDEEIRVGHEGENIESSLRNKALQCQSTGDCGIGSLVDNSKVECSSPGTAEARNVDHRSSTANVKQSKHLSRCETLPSDDLGRTRDEDAIKRNKLEDLSFLDIRNCETPNSQEHRRPSESELPTTSNFSKDETGESQICDTVKLCPAIESYSLRTRRKASSQEDSPKSKPKTPSKKSGSKDPKITCKEGQKNKEVQKDKEGITPAVPRRTSPRKRNRIDHDLGEDRPQSNIMFSLCDENLNSKMVDEEVRNDSLQGKERRSALKSKSCCIESLDKNSVLDVDDDDDCEPVSSQIFTGAPMLSGSRTRKRSLRGKGSSCQTLEGVSGAGEEMQLNGNDALKERVESMIPELEHEGEKRISNDDQSNNSNLKQACVEATSPCHDVLKASNRQRRSQEQSEITVITNEHMDTDLQKEEKTLKRTQKGSKICEQSKKLKCLGNKIDVMDDQNNPSSNASVEIPLQTVHEVRNGGSCTENKEAPENIENVDGPTPPEKRPIRRARRGRPRARKSASALIDILTAASASALKRVSDSAASQPSSKENQESIQTDQTVASKKKKQASSKKGKVQPKARQSRKRKFPGGSPGGDDPVKSGKLLSCGRLADEQSNVTADSSPGQNAAMLRLECVSHDEGSGDDDDELMNPVLTPDSKTKDLPPAFNVGEVVWAQDSKDKSRWPAVVIEVAGENVSRRVYNVFKTNQTKEQYFQVKSSRYLKQYNCREKEAYLEKGKQVTEFKTAVERANDFIMKIGLGKVNSYEDFFKPNDAYFDSPPPSPPSTSPPSPPLVVGHSSPEYPLHGPKINQHVGNDDDDEEEEDESLNDSQSSVKNSCNGNAKEITRLKRKWQRKEKRLLEHMRSEQTKEYLFGIQHGTVASVRHQWFLSSNANDKGRLKWGSCGALISENKRMDIMDYLKNLLNSDKSPLSSTRYMMDVALPEALNFAYQKVYRVSKDEAERVIPMDGQQVIRDLDIG